MKGINIFSGEKGLGAALTNPTTIAYRKGGLVRQYEVRFYGCVYIDAEEAYHCNKEDDSDEQNDNLMQRIIGVKFRQHPKLFSAVKGLGGVDFLKNCSHWTQAKSASSRSWEGDGESSRFIRNLIKGYQLAESGSHIKGEFDWKTEQSLSEEHA